jgi:hypothetical protein
MKKKAGKRKTAPRRSTTRDLGPRKTAVLKGGAFQPAFSGGVFVAAGDIHDGGNARLVSR